MTTQRGLLKQQSDTVREFADVGRKIMSMDSDTGLQMQCNVVFENCTEWNTCESTYRLSHEQQSEESDISIVVKV